MNAIIDCHCHLPFGGRPGHDLAAVLARAEAAGIVAILDVGTTLESSRRVVERAARLPNVHPMVGWHPQDVKAMDEAGFRELMALAARPEVRGFGEIGLDYDIMTTDKPTQLRAFERLLEGATALSVPVDIHSRHAFEDTCRLLKKYAPRLKKPGVIHCFTLGPREAEAYLGLGFYLSFTGVVTYPACEELRQVAAAMPADKILVETDAPYLAPGPYKGQTNEPSLLAWHLMAVAAARDMTLNEAAALTTANAKRAFGL